MGMRLYGLALSLLLLPALVFADAARAQQAEFPIGVVDVPNVLRNSQAAEGIKAAIEERRNAYQAQMLDVQKQLKEEETALIQQRAILAPNAFQSKKKEFEERVVAAQRQVQERKQIIDQAFNKAMQEVRQVMVDEITKIADEKNLQLILFKNQIVLAQKSLDYSKDILERVNKRLPSVTVELPPIE